MFFAGYFNAKSYFWWPDGDETLEDREVEAMLSSLGLSQVIAEPTILILAKKIPSCIDHTVTDQPNIILESGTRSSLEPLCHHQIIYCKVNFRIPPRSPFESKIWHFNTERMRGPYKPICGY